MAITLAGISLPHDLEWQDEFSWSSVSQAKERNLAGKLDIEEASLLKGRPITLVGGANACWVTRATVEALQTLSNTAGSVHTLNYHGTSINVMFERDSAPVSAKQVRRMANPGGDPGHKYQELIIRLIEVE